MYFSLLPWGNMFFARLVFHCPAFTDKRRALQEIRSTLKIIMTYFNLLSSNNDTIIKVMVEFILDTGLQISFFIIYYLCIITHRTVLIVVGTKPVVGALGQTFKVLPQ